MSVFVIGYVMVAAAFTVGYLLARHIHRAPEPKDRWADSNWGDV